VSAGEGCYFEKKSSSSDGREWQLVKTRGSMMSAVRRSTIACMVTQHDQAVIKALTFLRKSTISEVLHAWIKPFIDQAAETPEVKKLLAIREQEGTRA